MGLNLILNLTLTLNQSSDQSLCKKYSHSEDLKLCMILWRVEVQEHTNMHTHTQNQTLCTSDCLSLPAPRSFHTWHRDKLTTRIHFIKMKTQSIQWAGNWKSFSLELLRVVQSLPADSTGGHGCRQPFVFNTPALPLSLQPHLTSFVYLRLSSFSAFTFSLLTTSHPPIETKLSRSCLSLHLRKILIFIYLLLFIYISFHLENTCSRHGTLYFKPSTTTIKCTCGLFVFAIELQPLFHIFFSGIFRLIFFPPLPFACSLHTRCFQMEGNKLKHHNKMQQERPSAHAQGK